MENQNNNTNETKDEKTIPTNEPANNNDILHPEAPKTQEGGINTGNINGIEQNTTSSPQQPIQPTETTIPQQQDIEVPTQPIQPIGLTTTPQSIQTTYPQSNPAIPQPELNNTNPMNFVLQWITYALWGWTLLVLSFVIFNLVLSILSSVDIGEGILYPISALIILLPASIVADVFYSKVEPTTKKGGALVIMVIHAVIYILFLVGFLIAAMFSFVSMMLNSGDSSDALGYIISSILVAGCYAILTARTLRPGLFRRGI